MPQKKKSSECCLSSQLLPWHPASAPPGQAKPQTVPHAMSAGCVNKALREPGENGPLKRVGRSQAGRQRMSSPLIPRGTETENKWSLTPLFSQGPASDLPLLRYTG
ncbi:hypothetical protein KUCAC02_002187 [Chaenocephalus aceratus]|uniref:Uncharacterized protein n=1 Tax=Chaenocephalus aceratus TaxID=36190 RepID=A0ACB9XUZ4_CHAAC|nr:hypothetical protein KUCAC02_002187 [Chaenocephalus aceratus]